MENYIVELTEKEVKGIGVSRWYGRNWKRFLVGLVCVCGWIVLTDWLVPSWEVNRTLCILGMVGAIVPILCMVVWLHKQLLKAERVFLEDIKTLGGKG